MAEKFQFEAALENLEKIVQALESGDLSLDQALKKYEEGVQLVRACQGRLADAEQKIEVLTRTLNGALKKQPFEAEDFGKNPSKTKKKRTVPARDEKTFEDEGGDA